MFPLYVAVAIVILSSVAFIAIGAAFKWDLTAEGYSLWNRIVGVVALLALVGVAAWSRIHEPLVAAGIAVGGLIVAICYVILYEKLTDRLRSLQDGQR